MRRLFLTRIPVITDFRWSKILIFLSFAFIIFVRLVSPQAIRAEPFAYVANKYSDDVSVLDLGSNNVIKTILVGDNPVHVAVTPNGKFAYVSVYSSDYVAVIDTATNFVVYNIPVASPWGIAISPDGKLAYVGSQSGGLTSVIDLSTNSVIDTISSFSSRDIAISKDGTRLYGAKDGYVNVADPATNTIIASIPTGASPVGIAVSPDGSRVYATNVISTSEGSVSIIDTATNSVIASVPTAGYPWDVAVAPDGAHAYAVTNFAHGILDIDAATNSISRTIPTTMNGSNISISRDGTQAYVTGWLTSQFRVYDLATGTNTAYLPVGSGTEGFAVTPIQTCSDSSSRRGGISAGYHHTCILTADGNVDCYGSNGYGQAEDYIGGDAVGVAAGREHTCILKSDGNVDCRGWDNAGQAEDYLGGDAVAVAGGNSHTCILKSNGNVDCYGNNYDGSGVNYAGKAEDYQGGDAIGISTGYYHTCVLKSDGNVDCYGWNNQGQANDYLGGDAVGVATGYWHTCILTASGNVDCYGGNAYGQTNDYLGGDAIGVAAGNWHTCVLTSSGNVDCYGDNSYGQAADYLGGDAIGVAAGLYHTCVLKKDGNAECFGYNSNGQSEDYLGGDAVCSVPPPPAEYFEISATTEGNGTISSDGVTLVPTGSSQLYIFSPDTGYQVQNVIVEGASQGLLSSYTFTNLLGDRTIGVSLVPMQVSITATATAGGTLSLQDTTQAYNYGYTPSYYATAAAGYHLVDVLVDGNSVGPLRPYTFAPLDADHTIRAIFAADPTWTITTVNPSGNGTITPYGATTVIEGESQSFSFTAGTGYHVGSVLVDGVDIGTPSSYTFTGVTADHTLAVDFVADASVSYTITATAQAGGSISAAGAVSLDGGEEQTFTITPDPGYTIQNVVANGYSQGPVNSYTYSNVHANGTITATFSPLRYTITATASAGGSISFQNTSKEYNHGTAPSYYANAASGYHLADILVDGVSVGAVRPYTFAPLAGSIPFTRSSTIPPPGPLPPAPEPAAA